MDIQSMKCLYQPCLYPLNLDHATPVSAVPSLVDLVSQTVVMDSTLTQQAIKELPNELCYNLLRAALVLSRDRAIEVLIAHWPNQVLSLQRFAPDLFSSLAMRYSEQYLNEMVRKAVKFTTCIAHTFVECLKKRTPTKLQCLDLTGYPTVEVIVNYLSSHVMLVFNEQRQREIIGVYNHVTRDLPDDQRQQYRLASTLPDQKFVIKVEMHIQTTEAHMEVCKALKTSKNPNCQFRFSANSLVINALSVARVSVLLDQVDVNALHGLCLQYIGLNREGIEILLPSFVKLSRLTSLDLSCNGLSMTSQEVCDLLVQVLSSLPCLSRLDLSNNRTKYKLRPLLSGITRPLQYLRLCACGISEMDITYLKWSHHTQALTELDISENDLSGNKIHSLVEFLKVVGPHLAVLELEDCNLSQNNFTTLFVNTTHLKVLKYLNISRNESLGTEQIFDCLIHLLKMDSLQALKVSYPVECYISQDPEQVQPIKTLLTEHIGNLTRTFCQNKGRSLLHIELTGP